MQSEITKNNFSLGFLRELVCQKKASQLNGFIFRIPQPQQEKKAPSVVVQESDKISPKNQKYQLVTNLVKLDFNLF